VSFLKPLETPNKTGKVSLKKFLTSFLKTPISCRLKLMPLVESKTEHCFDCTNSGTFQGNQPSNGLHTR